MRASRLERRQHPAHIAWQRNIREKFGVNIEYPIIADRDMKVARLLGMIHEPVSDTATVRAVFFIDPNQTIRALIYYPLQNGRSVDEILRAFVRLRQILASHADLARKLDKLEQKYDTQFRVVFDAIRKLLAPPVKKNPRNGFRVREESI